MEGSAIILGLFAFEITLQPRSLYRAKMLIFLNF